MHEIHSPHRDEHGPSPDVLLEEARSSGRGRLKIFLGAAPGVGKTYAMLETARLLARQGTDVVVGVVETHGRHDTQRLVDGLEILPPQQLTYRGRSFGELDVEALIERRPALALIDELAHSNIPGSRHLKRYQDVEDVLAAGIDVWSTLNVQHLESLNDVVTRISGVRVRETLPDTVLETATEIELIDLPTDELLKRLDGGKIYLGELAQRAREHFFTAANLTALRELAMRAAAERVDLQMQSLLRRHAVHGPWPTRDRLLVCIGGHALGKTLVRTAARLADHRGAQWMAIHVVRTRGRALSEAAKDRIADTLRTAEQLGGEVVTIPGDDVADEILRYAHKRNITQIVISRPQGSALRVLFGKSIARALVIGARDIEITIVPGESDPPTASTEPVRPRVLPSRKALIWALCAATGATSVGLMLHDVLGTPNMAVLYLIAVLMVALRVGTGAALAAAVFSATAFNYFFTTPRYSLLMHDQRDVITLLLLLVSAIFTGRIGAQIRGQVQALRKTAGRTANLNEFSRRLAGAMGRDEVVRAIVEHVHATLQCGCILVIDEPAPRIVPAARRGISPDFQFAANVHAAAEWSWQQAQASGYATSTLPSSDFYFVPLCLPRRVVGLIGLHMRDRGRELSAGQKRLLDAIADQGAVALERVRLARELEDKRLESETDQLRSALLASVSHDLRTPLVSILGAASSLRTQGERLPDEARAQLLDSIESEAERLNRFVQNLLDMTRLGHGRLDLRRDWCDLRDLVAQARRRLKRELQDFRVEVSCSGDPGLVHVDPMLIEQVLVNVLDNAAKFSSPGTTIAVTIQGREREVLVDMVDEGPGIPPADRERVFDLFYRVQGKDYIKPGTGLGLSICRGLLEAHAGSIRALSRPSGPGTLIRITLPASRPSETPDGPDV